MITKKDIYWLFDDVWPGMRFDVGHRDQCLGNFDRIEKAFAHHKKDFNALLVSLVNIDGVRLTIGSGLIFAAYRNAAVPFDKKTMYHALTLRLMRDTVISGGRYKSACGKIVDYCQKNGYKDIWAFVVEAEEMGYESWALETAHPNNGTRVVSDSLNFTLNTLAKTFGLASLRTK